MGSRKPKVWLLFATDVISRKYRVVRGAEFSDDQEPDMKRVMNQIISLGECPSGWILSLVHQTNPNKKPPVPSMTFI